MIAIRGVWGPAGAAEMTIVKGLTIPEVERPRMLKIQRISNKQVVFVLSGRMEQEDMAELETLIRSETDGRRIVLDLKDLTLAGQEAISFLERCEADGIALIHCAAYVREWITRERRGS